MGKIDMSPQAVTQRLQQVDELRDLCLVLAGPRLKRPWGVPSSVDVLPMMKEQPAPYGIRRKKSEED